MFYNLNQKAIIPKFFTEGVKTSHICMFIDTHTHKKLRTINVSQFNTDMQLLWVHAFLALTFLGRGVANSLRRGDACANSAARETLHARGL